MFYMMERDAANGDKLTEAYCTSYLNKAKLLCSDRSRQKSNSKLQKISERWREEWNRGVQMPLRDVKRTTYNFEGSRGPRGDTFVLSPRRIAGSRRGKYIVEAQKKFEKHPVQELHHYQIDAPDERWLEAKLVRPPCKGKVKSSNAKPSQLEGSIERKAFLEVMNTLEVECYRKIHENLVKPLGSGNWDQKEEADADCEICRLPEWESGDEIVFCDGCNIGVHQSCYGLNSLPTDEWHCGICAVGANSPACIFCPIRGGAMKYVREAASWAHVACALWLPEVRFVDFERRESITNVSHIPAERWQDRCSVCDTREGACIKCSEEGCSTSFHITCALRAGFVLHIESDDSAQSNGCRMVSLCHAHSHKGSMLRTLNVVRASPATMGIDNTLRLREMMNEFWKYVDCAAIAKEHQLSLQSVVTPIYKYWKWKRTQRGNQPLVQEPIELHRKDEAEELPPPKRLSTSPRRAFSPLSAKRIQEYEKLTLWRTNLEKARNLCYLLVRREKSKRAEVGTLEEALQLSERVTALSSMLEGGNQRNAEKGKRLLEAWRDGVEALLGGGSTTAMDGRTPTKERTPSRRMASARSKNPHMDKAEVGLTVDTHHRTRNRADSSKAQSQQHSPSSSIAATVPARAPTPTPSRPLCNDYEQLPAGKAYHSELQRKKRGASSMSSSTIISTSSSNDSSASLAESSTRYSYRFPRLSMAETQAILSSLDSLKPLGKRISLPRRLNGFEHVRGGMIKKNGERGWGLTHPTRPVSHSMKAGPNPNGLKYADYWSTRRLR